MKQTDKSNPLQRKPGEGLLDYLARVEGRKRPMNPRERQAFGAVMHARQTIRRGQIELDLPLAKPAKKKR